MTNQELAVKAVTVFQSAVTGTAQRDWVDYLLVIGSIGSIIVGLFAVWLGAKFSKEADLTKKYLDILISYGEEKFQSLSMLINHMNHFVQILELGIIKSQEIITLSWNIDASYHPRVFEALVKFNNLNSENLKYQSREMQAFIEIFRIKFDQIAFDADGAPKIVTEEAWRDLIIFQKSLVGMATPLLGLETNRRAMSVLADNDPKIFYKYLNENAIKLKEYRTTIEPAVIRFRSIKENWRNNI
jgi:hypothetical protein